MTKKTWLAASCAMALLMAGPAFAQNQSSGNNGDQGAPMSNGSMDQNSGASTGGQSMSGQSAQPHVRRHARNATRSDTSQNAEVEQLNEQSLQAAQQGRTFNVDSSGGTGDMGSSGNMGRAGSVGTTGNMGNSNNMGGSGVGTPGAGTSGGMGGPVTGTGNGTTSQ